MHGGAVLIAAHLAGPQGSFRRLDLELSDQLLIVPGRHRIAEQGRIGDDQVTHPDLLAVIEEGSTLQREHQGGVQTRQVRVVNLVAEAGEEARAVMVPQRVTGPAFHGQAFQLRQPFLLVLADAVRRQVFEICQREIEHEMELVIAVSHVGDVLVLAHEQAVAFILIKDGAQFLHQFMQARPAPLVFEHVVPVLVPQPGLIRCNGDLREAAQPGEVQGHGMRCEIGVFKNGTQGIQPETIHPHIQPESHCLPHGLAHLGIHPVEVRLLFHKIVVIELAARRHPGPGGTVEAGLPVVGHALRASWSCPRDRIVPDIPVRFEVIPAGG